MILGRFRALAILSVLAAGCFPNEALGQTWSVDVSAGKIAYDPVSVNAGTNNLLGTLRYDARRGAWVYGTAAAPLGDLDPFWGAIGTGGRFSRPRANSRVTFGAELGAHGFLFRDAVFDQTGNGGVLEAIPFASVAAGAGTIELRGGWRGQALAWAGVTDRRGVFETGARATYGETLRIQGDARWVHATEGSFPFAGATMIYDGLPVSVWAQAGRWIHALLDDVSWGAGAGVALGTRATLWANVRQEAPDPLYWNVARRTWSVGITQRLGRAPSAVLPTPRAQPGGVLIRVPIADAPSGQLSIAGSFNNWNPVPMQREGGEWVIRLPLTAGVYQYAFRSTKGEWFVPTSIVGRRDDGMGGFVAVLVVV